MRIAILGSGMWGCAISATLASNNVSHYLYSRNNNAEQSFQLLGYQEVPNPVLVIDDLSDIQNCEIILLAVPAQQTRNICKQLKNFNTEYSSMISCSKGIESDSLLFMGDVIREELDITDYGVLSGPTFATEVASGKPCTMTYAGTYELFTILQEVLSNDKVRLFFSKDVIGVQIAGVMKNVISIAVGMCDALELGNNYRASLISIALYEMSKLIEYKGGDRETVLQFCGVSDLVLTSYSRMSRNSKFGFDWVQKQYKKIDDMDNGKIVIEGLLSLKSIQKISDDSEIILPITNSLYDIIYNSKDPRYLFENIMNLYEK